MHCYRIRELQIALPLTVPSCTLFLFLCFFGGGVVGCLLRVVTCLPFAAILHWHALLRIPALATALVFVSFSLPSP